MSQSRDTGRDTRLKSKVSGEFRAIDYQFCFEDRKDGAKSGHILRMDSSYSLPADPDDDAAGVHEL